MGCLWRYVNKNMYYLNLICRFLSHARLMNRFCNVTVQQPNTLQSTNMVQQH
jgi:hypothetical protein